MNRSRYDIELNKPVEPEPEKPKPAPWVPGPNRPVLIEDVPAQEVETMRIYPVQLLITGLLSAIYTSSWWYCSVMPAVPSDGHHTFRALVGVVFALSIIVGTGFIIVMIAVAIVKNWNRGVEVH